MAWEGITFYWKHVLANLAATSTDAGYDIANILDRLDDTKWQAANTVTPQYIDITTGPGGGDSLTADFFGMGGHNFGTIGATATLQRSATGAWAGEEVDVMVNAPSDNKTFVKENISVSDDYWRLKISGSLSDKPYITHCYWGEKTELGFAEDLGDPDAFMDHDIINFSEEGDLLGVYGTWKEREIIFRFVFKDNAFWQTIVDWRENIDLLRFFMSWEKGEYPTENWLVSRKKGRFRNPVSINGLWREITLSLTGKMEQ